MKKFWTLVVSVVASIGASVYSIKLNIEIEHKVSALEATAGSLRADVTSIDRAASERLSDTVTLMRSSLSNQWEATVSVCKAVASNVTGAVSKRLATVEGVEIATLKQTVNGLAEKERQRAGAAK